MRHHIDRHTRETDAAQDTAGEWSGQEALAADARRALQRLATDLAVAHDRRRRGVAARSRSRPTLADVIVRTPATDERNAAHDSVVAYVAALRANGAAPQRMLRAVKTVVREAAAALDPHTRHVLTDDVVRWSIEAFYDGSSA